MYTVTATRQDEARKVEGTTPIDMYVLNASYSGWSPQYYANYNQDVYGYALNASGVVTATEQIYTAAVVSRGNITSNTEGEIGEVSLSVSNVDRVVESLIQDNDYLRGCDVHIVSFFAKHLPSGSTATYIGSSEDYNAGLVEKYYVDYTNSTEEAVTFICKSKFNIKNIVIPGRTYSRECAWEYGSSECGVTATVQASWTSCDKTLKSCRIRSNSARFGGFPSIPLGFTLLR